MKVAEDGYEGRDVHCKPLNFVQLQIKLLESETEETGGYMAGIP